MALGESAGILLKIKGDGSDAARAIAQIKAETAGLGKSFDSAGSTAEKAGLAIGSAITTAVTAAAGLAGTFLLLAKNTADFGSEIYDATQKTGLGAETMSALKFAADQAGSSFEQVTKGVTVFGVEVGKAADGNEKAQAKMKALGVTSTDLDTALKQVFKTIAGGKTATEQLALASEAFGKKIGPDLIPLIKDANGNFDEMVRKAKELGVTITNEDMRAADQFGDQLDLLQKQLKGTGHVIGFELMKAFYPMARDISNWLKANRGEVKEWGTTFANSLTSVAGAFKSVGSFVTSPAAESVIQWLERASIAANPLASAAVALGHALGNYDPKKPTPQPDNGPRYIDYSRPQDRHAGIPDSAAEDDAKKAAEQAAKERREQREKEAQERLASLKRYYSELLEASRQGFQMVQEENERAFLAGEKTAEEFRENSVKNISLYFDQTKNLIEKNAGVELGGAKSDQDRTNINLDKQNAIIALKRNFLKEEADFKQTIAEQDKKIEAAEKDADDEKIKRHERFLAILKQIGDEKQAEFEAERDRQQHADETVNAMPHAQLGSEIGDIRRSIEGGPTPDEGGGGIFGAWTDSWNEFFNRISEDAPTIGSTLGGLAGMMQNAFQGVAQAIGSVVQQWVLYGKTGPAMMRQVLASALATIAAEAAVRAIYMAAMGFAFLATGQYTDATNAFISAAIYGSVAAGAALAGRAVAGNSFNKQSQAATGGSGSGSGGGSGSRSSSGSGEGGVYSGEDAATFDLGRNAPNMPGRAPLTIHLKLDSDGVLKVLEHNANKNGRFRLLVQENAGY